MFLFIAPLAPLIIEASRLHSRDELASSAQAVSLEQPSGSVDLSAALSRLPGMIVRDRSGPGSLVTAFPATALSSGDTQLSIDEIPIINPLGTGINFSLFPAALVERLESRTAFDSALEPTHDPRPAPGGRINLKTLGPSAEAPVRASGVYGLYNTGVGTVAARAGSPDNFYLAGATLFTTDGASRYRDQVSGQVESRGGNDATGGGALAKRQWSWPASGGSRKFTAFVMGSHLDHSNAGSLTLPSKDHEKDDFHLFGAKLEDQSLSAKAAFTHTRTGVRGPDPASSTDDRTYTGFVQAGVTRPWSWGAATASFDNEYDRRSSNDGVFHRDIAGLTAQAQLMPCESVPMTVAPLVRQELSTEFSGARDYRIATLYEPNAETQLSASFGFDHGYPSITAHSGYLSGFGLVRANPNLGVERHRLWQASATKHSGFYTLYAMGFYDRVSQRGGFAMYPDGTAQYVADPEVQILGTSIDAQAFPVSWLSLRSGATVQRAQDLSTERELAYKPRWQALASATLRPVKRTVFTIEENYLGRRRFSAPTDAVNGESYLRPLLTTSLRLDYEVMARGVAFLRVKNLFDAAGFDNPGYPVAGRSFWLGFSYGEQPL